MTEQNLSDKLLRDASQSVLNNLGRAKKQANEAANVDRILNPIENSASIRRAFQAPAEKPFYPWHPDLSTPEQTIYRSRWQRVREAFTAPNLSVSERLRLLPFLGYFSSVLGAIKRLPLMQIQIELQQKQLDAAKQKIQQTREQVEVLNRLLNDRTNEVLHEIQLHLSTQTEIIERNFSLHDQRLADLEALKIRERLRTIELLDSGTRLMRLEQIEADLKLKQFARLLQVSEQENAKLRKDLHEVLAARSSGTDQVGGAGVEVSPAAHQVNAHGQILVDRFFRDFEDQFRGTREAIKQRLEVYLPYFDAAHYDKQSLVIDIGCGRGEWIELLAQHQISALGLDLNIEKVQVCIGKGLAARVDDGVKFLSSQDENSLGAVTGFHLIEHLNFADLLLLFEAAYRALKPGGLIIFETPNPENVLVGSCNFYFDPSHQHPIVPAVAQFIAQQSGFASAEIVRLHPYPDDHLAQGSSDADRLINRYFFGAQDFALVARK
ncbi:methyltransferase domain-containing protein [Undibacterium cyanobacteriorum]|uniref:Methyltransferase domain-containing protein n=1 Tax=Undibacterium cyanobacteriorum TaxID=3073561 RepID=A0ABY9RK79_9BURK|nr:methyltransferase domain-containing protein [Undibacterium sp. 20NA77.5]WMW81075.1 methyltransferase domain-containing protein [Undibacterium sp. 20NA77.5]